MNKQKMETKTKMESDEESARERRQKGAEKEALCTLHNCTKSPR